MNRFKGKWEIVFDSSRLQLQQNVLKVTIQKHCSNCYKNDILTSLMTMKVHNVTDIDTHGIFPIGPERRKACYFMHRFARATCYENVLQ